MPAEIAHLHRNFLASPQEIIDEARNGRMFVLVDDENRENEGDLVIPAQMVTPHAINFMSKYGRGLICLAITQARADALALNLMNVRHGTRFQTAFTTSIEARFGVTTGISAQDRARTVSVAIDASQPADAIVTPGHVFPLIAREGGVLVRAGHTEAAVDISRLAGLNPSGVICEIMKHDGTMARLDDLIVFAQHHDLKVGAICDLIAYRRCHDHLLEKKAELAFESRWGGQWRALTFYNRATATEQIALVKGHVDPTKPTLVRMHALSSFADTFGEISGRSKVLARSMEIIGEEGAGIVVIIVQPVDNWLSREIAQRTPPTNDAAHPTMEGQRDYGTGAQVLAELGVHDMVLLTNSRHTLIALEGYGLSIVGERAIPIEAPKPSIV